MKVKISTKEKFEALEVNEENFTANMTEDFVRMMESILKEDVKNVILNLKNVKTIDKEISLALVKASGQFKTGGASLVICELTSEVKTSLKNLQVWDILNITPTESEAGDIIQMDEIERELLDNDNEK